jgi:hypothetical protein
MPTIRKEIPRKSGEIISNRYRLRRFKHAQDMHKFLNTGDNALFWKETLHDLPSGVYLSQVNVCHETRKARETLTKV